MATVPHDTRDSVGRLAQGNLESDLPGPVALLLRAGVHRLWIAAAIPFDGGSHMAEGEFLLAMDHPIVATDETFAASIGLTSR